MRRGFPAATALHAAKVLECGAIATTPGSGSVPWPRAVSKREAVAVQLFDMYINLLVLIMSAGRFAISCLGTVHKSNMIEHNSS